MLFDSTLDALLVHLNIPFVLKHRFESIFRQDHGSRHFILKGD